jgi:hypothetical protein
VPLQPEFIKKWYYIPTLDTLKVVLENRSDYVFKIILTQGLNRQDKKNTSHHEVTNLNAPALRM